MERVFSRLAGQMGAKVADLFHGVPSADVIEQWGEALAGFRPVEIARGIRACQTRAFAPTAGEFALLCRPALDPEFAWLEASAGLLARQRGEIGEWSHPAVYRTALPMTYELIHQSYRQNRKTWAYRLAREFEQGWGDGVPPVPLAITRQALRVGPPPDAVRAQIARILNRPVPAAAGAQ